MGMKKHHDSSCSCPEEENHPKCEPCEQLPGTLLRIFIPPGAEINLLNLIEIDSPSGICLIVRLPLLGCLTGGLPGMESAFSQIIQEIQKAGGKVEVV